MYAAGGVGAGGVAGFGAYHLYNAKYGAGLGNAFYGRRRFGYGNDMYEESRFCVIPKGPQQGSFMECDDCRWRYLSCRPCIRSGCGYDITRPLYRDNLDNTGFFPKDFVSPLKVTFTRIESASIVKADVCGPQTEAESMLWERYNKTIVFGAGFFLTLAEQQIFQTIQSDCLKDTGRDCRGSTCSSHEECLENLAGHPTCMCAESYCQQDGYCVKRPTAAPTGVPTQMPTAPPPSPSPKSPPTVTPSPPPMSHAEDVAGAPCVNIVPLVALGISAVWVDRLFFWRA